MKKKGRKVGREGEKEEGRGKKERNYIVYVYFVGECATVRYLF